MQYVPLGRSGLNVSRICLGCMTYGSPAWRPWVLDEAASRPLIRRALELGITFFDTADYYSKGVSEEVVGRILKDHARRDEIVVATKVFYPFGEGPNDRGLSRKHIMKAIDASLLRLGMDHVDLYQIHRFDETTPIEETIDALDDVVRSGKARYLGASTMATWKLAKMLFTADARGRTRFISMQNHWNLLYREEERELAPFCRDQGIGMIPYSPLARGILAGNRRPGKLGEQGDTARGKTDSIMDHYYFREPDLDIVARVASVAASHGAKPAQAALAWVLSRPGVVAPVVGASRIEQLEEAAGALSLKLTDEQVRQMEEPYKPRSWMD
jgi:aryl-alcohol dehydrogenase-like predicted oxidoreductase